MLRMNRLENSISFSAVFHLFFKAFSSFLWPAVCFEGGAGKNISELKRELGNYVSFEICNQYMS